MCQGLYIDFIHRTAAAPENNLLSVVSLSAPGLNLKEIRGVLRQCCVAHLEESSIRRTAGTPGEECDTIRASKSWVLPAS